ncbi:MAG TPA: hypothetical protein VF017_07650 [Thermoanaerobaculia bacterium]|nr:hypothetical protein [Thermoanaerobaculia bacterium]
MSPVFYKLLHLLGVILLFLSLGGFALKAFAGGSATEDGKKIAAATHGLALLLLLVSGFGLLAKMQLGFPTWAWIKTGLWVILGGVGVAVRRMPWYAKLWWLLIPALGLLAAYLGVAKPAF